jgi:hypothetical protein
MAFRVFTAYGAASRPEATLRSSGYLFLSKGILQRAGDEKATYCQLQFDEEEGRLGIKLARASFDGEGMRQMSIEPSGASVNILPLLRYYGFPALKGKRVLPVRFEDGLIVLDLADEMQKPAKQRRSFLEQEQAKEAFDDDIPF